MLLEFKLYKINEESNLFKQVSQLDDTNEFIVVGEETIEDVEYFKVLQDGKNGLRLIGGVQIDLLAYLIKKENVTLVTDGIGYDCVDIDIPKEYLSMDLIETIQRLNE